MYPSLTM